MTLIGYVFPKLRAEKDLVRKVSKNASFRRPFSQTLSISAQQHF